LEWCAQGKDGMLSGSMEILCFTGNRAKSGKNWPEGKGGTVLRFNAAMIRVDPKRHQLASCNRGDDAR